MFCKLKQSFFSSKTTYESINIVDEKGRSQTKLSVDQTAESSQYENNSLEDISIYGSEYSFAKEYKMPMYKEALEFLMSGFTGFALAVGFTYIAGIDQPKSELLASFVVTSAPYFNGRLTSYLSNIWLSNPKTSPEDYKPVIKRVAGFTASGLTGLTVGSFGLFKSIGMKESAFMGSLGLVAGKAVELGITAYEEKKACFKKQNEIKITPK